MDYSIIEHELCETLGLSKRPVAVTFRGSAPPGVPKFAGSEPSSCSFWRIAAAGMTFYTVPSDHYNCAMGSYTLNISLPPERAEELERSLSLMTGIGYIKMEEIPSIARLPQTPLVVVYSPLGSTPTDPDLVLCVVRPMQAMILQEAALRSGVGLQLPLLGRPTCMSLPAALTNGMVTCAGCIGNRIYTDLGEDELYVVIPGRVLLKIANEVEVIAQANAKLADYHRGRREALRSRPE